MFANAGGERSVSTLGCGDIESGDKQVETLESHSAANTHLL